MLKRLLTKRVAGIVTATIVGGGSVYYYLSSTSVEYVFPVVYPNGLKASNYWWDLQFSTNLTNWTTVRTAVTGTVNVQIDTNINKGFYRFKGRQ